MLLSQICNEAVGCENEEDAGGDPHLNDLGLPVYLQLLAMQPALVPISMLLPAGGTGMECIYRLRHCKWR